ncbi:hypothetical protein KUV46_15040 [Thalassovita mediterranea]|nr:hypothetical protein KUV46_15040 [Thalassovita mediterranea]
MTETEGTLRGAVMAMCPFEVRAAANRLDYLPLRFGRCVSVDAAADFAALLADFDCSVFAAVDAALAELTFDVFDWASAEPAADFADLDAEELRRVLDAALAADFPVLSVLRGMDRDS